MPRVYLTETDRERAALERLEARRACIIRVAAAKKGVSLRRVALDCGLPYSSFIRRVSGERPFDLSTLAAVTRYFEFDPGTALVLLTGKGKSPYEITT